MVIDGVVIVVFGVVLIVVLDGAVAMVLGEVVVLVVADCSVALKFVGGCSTDGGLGGVLDGDFDTGAPPCLAADCCNAEEVRCLTTLPLLSAGMSMTSGWSEKVTLAGK